MSRYEATTRSVLQIYKSLRKWHLHAQNPPQNHPTKIKMEPENTDRLEQGNTTFRTEPFLGFHMFLVGGWTNPFEKYARQL